MHTSLTALESVFGAFTDSAAVERERVRACEARLGRSLPAALRELYCRTGSHPLHRQGDRLVPLEALSLGAGHLVFYEQDQGAMRWGLATDALAEDDPAVWVLFDDGDVMPDSDSISDFLLYVASSQAVEGALPVYALLDGYVDADVFSPRALEAWGPPLAKTRHGDVYVRNRVICLHRAADEGFLGLAAREPAAFADAARSLGVTTSDWTVSSFEP